MPVRAAASDDNNLAEQKVDRRRTNTRERIEEIATGLFYDQGFQATSIRQIVERCAITPGAFYNHFETKDALLYGIVKSAHDLLEKDMAEALATWADNPAMALSALVQRHVLFHTRNRLRALVSNREYGALPEDQSREIRGARLRVRGLFESTIVAGLKTGVFVPVPTMDEGWPRITAIAIGEMGLRTADWYRPNHGVSEQQLADAYAEMALRMVGWRSAG